MGKRSITLKVAPKGGLSVYGLGAFPTTLYPGQWLTILDNAASIREAIEKNKDTLTWRPEDGVEKPKG